MQVTSISEILGRGPVVAPASSFVQAHSDLKSATTRALGAALLLALFAPGTAESKQLCKDPEGSSSCCKAWGGTWVTGGSNGFCYRNLKIRNPVDEAACKAAGGKAETKDGEKVCSVPFGGNASAD